MTSVRCPRHYCGALLDASTDGMGRVVMRCLACARNRRGFCRDCPARLPSPRHMRCAACNRERILERDRLKDRERYAKWRRSIIARLRERRRDPEVREYRRQYMANYRAAHPRDGFDRAYQRVYMAARRADPEYRARQNARRRELKALRKAKNVAQRIVTSLDAPTLERAA